jgi:hypothetical protein
VIFNSNSDLVPPAFAEPSWVSEGNTKKSQDKKIRKPVISITKASIF